MFVPQTKGIISLKFDLKKTKKLFDQGKEI